MNLLTKVFLFLCIISSFSCSLNYTTENVPEAKVPEFIFTNASLYRYEKNKISMKLNAENLEQYKNKNESYAKKASFYTFNEKNEIETEGSCYFLAMDSKKEIYTLFNNVLIKHHPQHITLKAQNLLWNGNTEQLISGKQDKVFLTKDNLQVEGTGFSASSISNSYKFLDNVKGSFIQNEDSNTSEENNEEK